MKMTKILSFQLLCFGLIAIYITSTQAAYPYYGTKIGPLTQLHHKVAGDVYAVDSRTIFIKNFNYDGEAPAAYFYVGNTNKPSNDGGIRLRDEKGGIAPITRRYRNKDITLSLPEGKTLRDIKWFSFWCDEFAVNFGDVTIPSTLDYPKPQKISKLNGVHGVSSDNIVIVDAQTLLIPNFSYDGEAPDAKFWVGRGPKPSPQGLRIPDENGKETPLRRYEKKTIVLTLPSDLTVFDIGHFGVWCEAFTVDFGHIRIPDGLNIPPSLKMLGISPQSKLNCEVLYDDLAFEVRWAVAGESIVVQLVAKLDDNEYMSFGISPNNERTEMIGADAVVAWVDKDTGKGFAQDYFLDDKSQCSGKRGSCPDTNIEEKTNSIRLLNAAMVNGYSIVTYQRSLKASDKLDLPILVNRTQAIVWAIGPLNQKNEVSFHSKYTKGNQIINFGRQPTWNCPMPEAENQSKEEESDSEEFYDARPQQQQQSDRRKQQQQTNRREQKPQQLQQQSQQSKPSGSNKRPVPTPKPASKNGAWEIPPIQCYEPEDGVFYAQLGPTGGKHGYPAITGHVGWGISWYINGLLIPEIHVVRGKSYNFVVEGGNEAEVPAKYHPFYITDDPIGGYEYKTEEEKAAVKIFAGIHKSRSGKITPTGIGRLCNWTPDQDGPPADDYQSFGAYQRTLTLVCNPGEPGIITWTPDSSTPDTVYYHCFTHRYLGWKIHVHDTCDEEGQASEVDEVYSEPEDDFLAESSIRHETRLRPTDNFLEKHEKDLIKHHNMAEIPPKVNFDLMKTSEIHKLITDGIRAAEALEESISKKNIPPTQSPNIQTAPTEVLEGEVLTSQRNISKIFVSKDNIMLENNEPMTFLRPPATKVNSFPVRPIKLISRRPPPMQIETRRHQRPVVLPQPSMIVNHYRKAIPAIMKPFMKEKPFPIEPIASVLMMGSPTDIERQEPILKSKRRPPTTYLGVAQEAKKRFSNLKSSKVKTPFIREKPEIIQKPLAYKKPFEVKEIKEVSPEIATLEPAVNTGFKAEKVIVESGFRPILRLTDTDEPINRRKDDAGAEIDEVMETDTLFLSQPTDKDDQSFEPMFIPSPLDSTNTSIIKKSIADENDSEINTDEELGEEGAAAERLDIYYLPPDNRKRPTFSKIPDGAVVTYDGKAVLDSSLLRNAPASRPQFKEKQQTSRLSKTEQLIRNTPQFRPFRGEIPPAPIPDFLTGDAPQLRLKSSLHKPITEYSNPLTNSSAPISTRLVLRKNLHRK